MKRIRVVMNHPLVLPGICAAALVGILTTILGTSAHADAFGEVLLLLVLPGILVQTLLSVALNGDKSGFGSPWDVSIIVSVNLVLWYVIFCVVFASFKQRNAFFRRQ